MSNKKKSSIATHGVYINRELSWLSFAQRVLTLAEDPDVPLLERVKFVGIMGMLYDEFAMKRLGGLRQRIKKKSSRISSDGLTPNEELEVSRKELYLQIVSLCKLLEGELKTALADNDIPIFQYAQLNTTQQQQMHDYFHDSVEPILTPLAVDVSHPFPFISTLGLNLAVFLHDSSHKKNRFVRIKIPQNRPRWVKLSGGGYVPIEEIIAANLGSLFPAAKEIKCYQFRIIRGAKDNPWDRIPLSDEDHELMPGSIIGMVTAELTARKFAGIVQLQVSEEMPEKYKLWLAEQFDTSMDDVISWKGLMNLNDLVKLQPNGFPELRDPPHQPVSHPRLKYFDRDDNKIFDEIKHRNILLHLPYHSFDSSILCFLRAASVDPKVLAIKLTIYRTNTKSPIVKALIEAARRGKQVAVLVEITARFDEEPNIAWGKMLEDAGAHVIYGMERLKTHVKLGLVVREEEEGLRRYVHVSTGNYHAGTARLYEDLGILSADPELGENVAAVFNEITGSIQAFDYGNLLVAPHNLRQRFTQMIRREAEHSRNGRACGIHAKMNQLQDPKIIQELYLAAKDGVPITLNIRGICCLRAGVVGLSENIKVYSVLGRFLEHSRIYRFENAASPEYFIGSADWMRRNLDSRMETVMQVHDETIKQELKQILDIYEHDNVTAWDMQADGSYQRRTPADGEVPRASQEIFISRNLAIK